MTRKTSAPISLFCEWVVGTSIPAALGPIPKSPPKRREVVTVEVLTDDETEEDTLRITYPRSGRSKKEPAAKDVPVKKVRFEDTPKKSAMKKKPAPTPDESDSASDTGSVVDSSDSDAPSPAKKSSGKKSKKVVVQSSDSEDDSEPHPTCDCKDCVRGRQKQKQSKKCTKKAESSDSENSDVKKNGKNAKDKKKGQTGNKGKDGKEAESSASETESAKDTEDETDTDTDKNKKEDAGKKNQNQGKKNKKKQNDSEPAKAQDEKDSGPAKASPGKDKPKEAKDQTPKKTAEEKKPSYPSGFPGPHPRRPNLIEPIRAEVVHTERVIETPEDPPPNAYYDSENNIVRIYHGPVYGHHGHALYPKRNPSHLPLPIGMPHPAQNPYYHGFERPQDNLGHVPITQGMPVPAWNAYCAPAYAGYPAYMTSGPPPAPWPVETNANANAGVDKTKGAFSMPPSTKDQDIAGGNNVLPPIKDNPYLQKRSAFASLGSQRADGSPRNSITSKKAGSTKSAFGNSSPKSQNQWGDGGNQNQTQDAGWPGAEQTSMQDATQDATWGNSGGTAPADNSWGANVAGASENTWGNQETQNDTAGATGSWGGTEQKKDEAVMGDNNNVMPGGWDSTPGPAWGDPTMAASTGGAVNW